MRFDKPSAGLCSSNNQHFEAGTQPGTTRRIELNATPGVDQVIPLRRRIERPSRANWTVASTKVAAPHQVRE